MKKIFYAICCLCFSVLASRVEISGSFGYNDTPINKKDAVQYVKVRCVNFGNVITGTFKIKQVKQFLLPRKSLYDLKVFKRIILHGTNNREMVQMLLMPF